MTHTAFCAPCGEPKEAVLEKTNRKAQRHHLVCIECGHRVATLTLRARYSAEHVAAFLDVDAMKTLQDHRAAARSHEPASQARP